MSTILCFQLRCNEVIVYLFEIDTKFPYLFAEIKTLDDILIKLKTLPIKNVKSVLVCLWSNYALRKFTIVEALKNYYEMLRIPFLCMSWNSMFISSALLAAVEEYGEKVLEDKMDFIFCDEKVIAVFNVVKESGIFKILTRNGLPIDSLEKLYFQNLAKVFITCKHKSAGEPVTEKEKQVEKMVIDNYSGKSFCIINRNLFEFTNDAIVTKACSIFTKNKWKYDVANIGIADYALTFPWFINNTVTYVLKKSLIGISNNDIVPIKKKIVCFDNFSDVSVVIFETQSTVTLEKFPLIECGTSISLSVDKYFSPIVEVQPHNTEIRNGAIMVLKENTLTVEAIKNGKLIDIGLKNIPIMLSFIEGKIQIGNKASEQLNEEKFKSFIIFDLIKIMKSDPKKLKIDPKWGFKVLTEKDKILLEFDTFRGRRKSSPSFLFAFLIKFAVKNVELISSQIPDTVIIVCKFIDDQLKNNLMESCKTLKLNNVQINEYKIIEI